jgi:Protein of unknown function (DUF1236)
MTNRLMMSVAAAALIAGTGFANAQGTGMGREAPSTGSAVQQSAPPSSGSAGTMSRESTESTKPSDATKPSSGMKATQSEEKMSPNGAKNLKGEKSAQDNMQGQKSKSMNSENDNARDNAKGGTKDMKAEGRDGRNGNMNAETKGASDSKSQTTTGQAGASAKLSTEQRTRITTVIRNEHVAPVNNVNFSITVGTRVPREGVSFRPLPAEVATIYPEWRGYEFILVRDQIVVVDPRTFEIVAIIDA